jgi:hypothetical protein
MVAADRRRRESRSRTRPATTPSTDSGLSNPEICAELVISEATAKTHVARILRKLDLRDRIQAVIYAYETGLVRPSAT